MERLNPKINICKKCEHYTRPGDATFKYELDYLTIKEKRRPVCFTAWAFGDGDIFVHSRIFSVPCECPFILEHTVSQKV